MNVSDVQMFCGLASYYRDFVQDIVCVDQPVHNLTRKNEPFNWDDDCEVAFLELKKWLTSTPILVAPCDAGTYVLDTDASDTALEPCCSRNRMVSFV